MAWRLIEVPDGEQPNDLTDGELMGVSICLAHVIKLDRDIGESVYHRAYIKMQEQVLKAMRRS